LSTRKKRARSDTAVISEWMKVMLEEIARKKAARVMRA